MRPDFSRPIQTVDPMATPLVKSTVKILLVDDEPRNLDVLETSLQSADYELVRALTAQTALLSLIDGEFAAVVLDIQMPEMSGFELANLIKQRKRTQHIPIIFLTAYFQDDKDVLEGYGTGAVDYLTKPINPQILKSKIAVFVELFRKNRALSEANTALEQEIARRQTAEEALRQINDELERRVQQRTADLTRLNAELRVREIEVVQARDRALAASRAKDEFFARLSHELRTPLNPVLLIASDAAANSTLPSDVRADFKRISENVELEARLIDDLLDLTRISEGKLTLELRPFDFHTVIQDAVGMVRADLLSKRINLQVSVPAESKLVVGDDVRLRQVFWNVLKNAVKFTPANGNVTLEVEGQNINGTIVVRVIDTGIGMTPPEIERAFDAFSQGDHAKPAGAHRYGGLGLGLAISRMLVELHGGSICAHSNGRNQGATFTIELPLPPAGANAGELGKLPAVPTAGERPVSHRRILLVEDHLPTSTALNYLLVRRGYQVVTATCVAEAQALFEREKFDVLISDLDLPDGNGCELMTGLSNGRKLLGIALTGFGMDDDVKRSKAAGFSTHLTKPVKMQELDRALQSILSIHSERRPG